MANSNSGVCAKHIVKGKAKRKHEMKQKIDNLGHKYEACEKCGCFFIQL